MKLRIVYFYVFDSLSDWEAGFAIAGINNPAYQVLPGRFVVRTAGVSKQAVKTIGGITILPDTTLAEITPQDSAMFILTGGGGWESGRHTEAVDKAGEFLKAGKPVAAICGATFGLAKAGILDAVRHTSNARVYLQATDYKGGENYLEEPVVTDGNLITAGTTAPVDFAYAIFKKLGIYSDATLEAWLGLYKTGELKYFLDLQKTGS